GGTVSSAACRHYDIFFSVQLVNCRRCVRSKGKNRFPKQLSRLFIEGAKFVVVVCGADENETAGCDYTSSMVLGACALHPFGDEFGIFAQRHLPDVLASI